MALLYTLRGHRPCLHLVISSQQCQLILIYVEVIKSFFVSLELFKIWWAWLLLTWNMVFSLNDVLLELMLVTLWKKFVFGVFLVRIFRLLDRMRDTLYLSLLSPNSGKYGPEKNPNTDTYTHWVVSFKLVWTASMTRDFLPSIFGSKNYS